MTPSNTFAYEAGIALLYRASCKEGFLAAPEQTDNYRRVWSRDGVICSLAALQSGDDGFLPIVEATLETLFNHQHPAGFMPSNVTPQTNAVSYGGAVGRADNASWAIIGLMHYTQITGNTSLKIRYQHHVEKAFQLMTAWEFNGRGLMYVPLSGDWADEYIQHGYIFYDQLLRLWALELAGKIYERNDWLVQANLLRITLGHTFWQQSDTSRYYTPALARQMRDASPKQWLMGFHPGGIYCQFDLAANALAILLQVGEKQQQTEAIKTLIDKINQQDRILPAYSPAILSNDINMNVLKENYAYQFRNSPHQFHNGGLWPVWNGWAVVALAEQHDNAAAKDAATKLCALLHQANASANNNEFEFNEVLHGETMVPVGVKACTWSAAGAVLAETSLNEKKIYRF